MISKNLHTQLLHMKFIKLDKTCFINFIWNDHENKIYFKTERQDLVLKRGASSNIIEIEFGQKDYPVFLT